MTAKVNKGRKEAFGFLSNVQLEVEDQPGTPFS